MKDLALVPGTNRFLLQRRGMTMTSDFLQYMQQKVRASLSLFKGEWYLDKRLGLPYIPSWDIEKDGHRAILESAIRVKVSGIGGIKKLLSFETEFDKRTRLLSVSLTAQCDSGETLEVRDLTVGGTE